MANKDVMDGFKPVMHKNGTPYNGSYRKMYAAENLFLGDLVEPTATGLAGASGGAYQAVARAETGDPIAGVVVGWEFAPATLTDKYCRSGNVVYVADCSDLVLEAQTDGAAGSTVAADVGFNIDFVVTAAGSTTTGLSGMEINSATEATTNTLDLRIYGMVDRPDNDITDANPRLLVTVNRNWTANQIAGV